MGTENNAIILPVVICFVAAALGSFAVFMLVSSAKAESRKLYHGARDKRTVCTAFDDRPAGGIRKE